MATPITIIKPAGILDGVKANELRRQVSELLAAGNNLVLLDMADVNFIDSSGLSALIVSLKMLRTAGGDLYLCSIAEPVRNLLSITRMDRLFENSLDSISLAESVLIHSSSSHKLAVSNITMPQIRS